MFLCDYSVVNVQATSDSSSHESKALKHSRLTSVDPLILTIPIVEIIEIIAIFLNLCIHLAKTVMQILF